MCACEDTQNWDRAGLGGYVLLSHTNTVPALSLHPHNAALAKAFTADPEKIIWGAGKSEGCLSWKKERVGGNGLSKADKGDMAHKKSGPKLCPQFCAREQS